MLAADHNPIDISLISCASLRPQWRTPAGRI